MICLLTALAINNGHTIKQADCTHLSQEGYAAAIVDEMGLSSANKSPLMMPLHSGFPIDAIPHVEMSQEDRAPLISKIQCWLGC